MMFRYLNITLLLVICTVGTSRAATKPHAVPPSSENEIWNNEDLERLNRIPGLVSVVGRPQNSTLRPVEIPAKEMPNPEWSAAQAASLSTQLEAEQDNLRAFTHALDAARQLKNTTGGINLFQYDLGITRDATIHILQERLHETEDELDALEDLARRNGVEPGILRGQSSSD